MTYYCHTETTRNPNPDNTYTIKVTQYPHEWIYDSGPADTEHHYTCAKCGQTKNRNHQTRLAENRSRTNPRTSTRNLQTKN